MSQNALKLIILDRDGVINADRDDYVKSAEEWQPLSGSLEALALLTQAGYRIAIATNQSGIARGFYTLQDLHAMHQKMADLLTPLVGRIDSIFFCPHVDADQCKCRKPLPGMYLEIANRYLGSCEGPSEQLLKGVPVVGDSLRDLLPASTLGAQLNLVLTGKGKHTLENGRLPLQTAIYENLLAFTHQHLGQV